MTLSRPRGPLTTSAFLILNISGWSDILVFVCVVLYIARSGLLHGGSGGIEKLVSAYCCRHFYSGPVNEKKKRKNGTAYSFISTRYCSADRYTVCVDQGFLHVSLFYSWL